MMRDGGRWASFWLRGLRFIGVNMLLLRAGTAHGAVSIVSPPYVLLYSYTPMVKATRI